MAVYRCTELKLIWSNTVSCWAQNRSISVCSQSNLIGKESTGVFYDIKPTLHDCFESFLSTIELSSMGCLKAFSAQCSGISPSSQNRQSDQLLISVSELPNTIRVLMSTSGICWFFLGQNQHINRSGSKVVNAYSVGYSNASSLIRCSECKLLSLRRGGV